MKPEQLKKIIDLVLSFGSAQFMKGSHLADEDKDYFEDACTRSERYLRQLVEELSKV